MHEQRVRQADVWRSCNKLRAAALRSGLDLRDWFRPLDPRADSLVSESQFVGALGGAAALAPAERAQLADYFRAPDGRVHYAQLCRLLYGEDGDDTPELEVREPAGRARDTPLPPGEARRLACLLATLAARRLPLDPYFQDYELVCGGGGRVTFAHFARVLLAAGVRLAAPDFRLLLRAYRADGCSLHYDALLRDLQRARRDGTQGLGPEWQHPQAAIDTRGVAARAAAAGPAIDTLGAAALDPADIMRRVQRHVLEYRVRLADFFRDYDTLRTGLVSAAQFVRALCAAGLRVSAAEAACLARHYAHPAHPGQVCWRTFEDDCDQVFTVKELEKHPQAASRAPAPGPGPGPCPVPGEAEGALQRLRGAVLQRSLDLRPFFQDHDRLRSGRVSRAAWRRALGRAGAALGGAVLGALERRYCDHAGFHYARLLHDLEEQNTPAQAAAEAGRGGRAPAADPAHCDIVQILAKIRSKVIREGACVRDFVQQFDPRRAGHVSAGQLHRALCSAGLALAPGEVDTLAATFAAPARPGRVLYGRLCAAVERVRGGLERAPLLEPVGAVPPREPRAAFLQFEERAALPAVLRRLDPDHVSNILEVFKELDGSGRGTVRAAALPRALARRGLLARLSARDLDLLARAFAAGDGDLVNYRALCAALDVLHDTAC